MIIHNYGKRDYEAPAAMCAGFSCDTVTLDAKDARYVLRLYETQPEQFKAWLYQFAGRFNGNRLPNKPMFYEDTGVC